MAYRNRNSGFVMAASTALRTPSPQASLRWVRPPQQERTRASLTRLLDAAETLLGEKSFDEVSIAEVTREARTSIGGFYRRFADKDGLLHALHERFCDENGVQAASVSVVGAVQRAAYAYYNQTTLQYKEMLSPRHHELSGLVGNISMRDGRPFLHAHATFADINGECVAGHLLKGCVVWVAEVEIRELTGVEVVRQHDERTGLALW